MKLLNLIVADRKIRDASDWLKEDLLIDVSPNDGLAIFVIAWTRELVRMPDQIYIQCGHNEHMLR